MTKIPNVDWLQVQEDGPIHKSDARQDNMREVRTQLGGSAQVALGANADSGLSGELGPTQATLGPPSCQCPYGWHAVHAGCYSSQPVPQYDGWPEFYIQPNAELAKTARERMSRPLGIGETMFSPEEIAHWRAEALRLYHDSMNEVQAANERRYLEGDTEFSDDDIEDYYLGKAG